MQFAIEIKIHVSLISRFLSILLMIIIPFAHYVNRLNACPISMFSCAK